MSFQRAILALVLCSSGLAHALQIDASSCAADLSPAVLNKLITNHARQNFAGGEGSFIPGDAKASKLIDVRGADFAATAKAVIRHLRFDQDAQKIPHLEETLTAALKIARGKPAALSISSWMMPEGERTVRISLDMSTQPADRSQVLRLPDLDIRNGTPVRRVDIDLSPSRMTLLTGTTHAVHVGGKWLIGEPASHSLGLEIDAKNPEAVVLDSFGAEAGRFIGRAAVPELRELLTLTENLARAIFPGSHAIQFRVFDDIKAISESRGWQTVN